MAEAKIETKEIRYEFDGMEAVGFLAKPKNIKENRPAVLVVHEWWGQTEYPRRRAKMLAELGYIAMAVDMYGGRQTADHPKSAGQFSSAVMSDAKKVRGRFEAALNAIKSQPNVDSGKIAAIGYCFGGSVALEMVRQGLPLRGVATFHAGLKTPTKAEAGKVKAKILIMNGADDTFVSAADIEATKAELKAAGADFEFIDYPGAVHGFSNPEATANGKKFNIPLAYNEKTDNESWNKMKGFFETVFK